MIQNDRALTETERQLDDFFAQFDSIVVAFSGGVDSAVVASCAHRVLADCAVAVTADSPSLAESDRQTASRVAEEIGIEHAFLSTTEFEQTVYRRNDTDRCFHCKNELYRTISEHPRFGTCQVVVNGTNLDDLDDFRPGHRAGWQWDVRSPLAELGIGKSMVRLLAAKWGLSVADKPASPCLSSRVAYSIAVTPERVKMIDRAETYLRQQGIATSRVRLHHDDLARIEVTSDDFGQLIDPSVRGALLDFFHDLGFRFVTLDLDGFRSGSLNQIAAHSGTFERGTPVKPPGKNRL